MSSLPPSSSKTNIYVATAIILAVYAGVNYICLGKLQLCMWRAAIGFPCPGCGLTHAGLFLLSGNIRESLIWHPFLVPIVVTIAICSIPDGKFHWADRFRQHKWWGVVLVTMVVGYFFWRLFAYFPQGMDEGPMYFDPHNYLTRIWMLTKIICSRFGWVI